MSSATIGGGGGGGGGHNQPSDMDTGDSARFSNTAFAAEYRRHYQACQWRRFTQTQFVVDEATFGKIAQQWSEMMRLVLHNAWRTTVFRAEQRAAAARASESKRRPEWEAELEQLSARHSAVMAERGDSRPARLREFYASADGRRFMELQQQAVAASTPAVTTGQDAAAGGDPSAVATAPPVTAPIDKLRRELGLPGKRKVASAECFDTGDALCCVCKAPVLPKQPYMTMVNDMTFFMHESHVLLPADQAVRVLRPPHPVIGHAEWVHPRDAGSHVDGRDRLTLCAVSPLGVTYTFLVHALPK